MRIISGQFKGRNLSTPADTSVRPTGSRTREALFNLLMHGSYGGDAIIGQPVADICCGTGALGFEALSRGASSCIFLDRDLALAKKNAQHLGLDLYSPLEGESNRPCDSVGGKFLFPHGTHRASARAFPLPLKGGAKVQFVSADASALPPAPHPVACVFLDAPYHSAWLAKTLQLLVEKHWLLPEAIICVEQEKREPIHEVAGLHLRDHRDYGKASLRIYQQVS